ncbi:MAG: DUF6468 domain-containing protein [Sphingomonas sp.]
MIANLLTIALCAGVMVQSIRMIRLLNAVKRNDLSQVVGALDQSTLQARIVLSELKGTLTQCATVSTNVTRAAELAEELQALIDVADASAERLVAAATAGRAPAEDDTADSDDDAVADAPEETVQ